MTLFPPKRTRPHEPVDTGGIADAVSSSDRSPCVEATSGETREVGHERRLAYKSGYAIAVYILVCAVITLIAAAMMKDYTGKDIEGEYE
jgi:hypothetical protein